MILTVAILALGLAFMIGATALRLLGRRIDAAIDRNLPDPRWY